MSVMANSQATGQQRSSRHRLVRGLGSLARHPTDVWLVTRMAGWRIALVILQRSIPLPHLARMMSTLLVSKNRQHVNQARVAWLATVAYAVGGPGARNGCLSRSLVIYRYLSRAEPSPQLVVGVRKDGSKVFGHAWVEVAGRPVAESEASLAAFTPLMQFGTDGRMQSAA
jgi:hypothetical protein